MRLVKSVQSSESLQIDFIFSLFHIWIIIDYSCANYFPKFMVFFPSYTCLFIHKRLIFQDILESEVPCSWNLIYCWAILNKYSVVLHCNMDWVIRRLLCVHMFFANPINLLIFSCSLLWLCSLQRMCVISSVVAMQVHCTGLFKTGKVFCWGKDASDAHVLNFLPASSMSSFQILAAHVWKCMAVLWEWLKSLISADHQVAVRKCVQTETYTLGLQDRAGLNPLASGFKENAWSSYFRWRYVGKANLDFRISFGPSKSLSSRTKVSCEKVT